MVFSSIPEVPELAVQRPGCGERNQRRSDLRGGHENRVEEIMVGAMYEEAAMKVMRRVARKALITGGDRATCNWRP